MKRHTLLSCTFISLVALTTFGCDSGTAAPGSDTSTANEPADTISAADATAPADTTAPSDDAGPAEAATPWGVACSEDSDCEAPTDYCVTQPGAEFGYCTIACLNGGADCTYDDWTCNIIGTCDAPAATWCGPPEEIPNSDGFLIACP